MPAIFKIMGSACCQEGIIHIRTSAYHGVRREDFDAYCTWKMEGSIPGIGHAAQVSPDQVRETIISLVQLYNFAFDIGITKLQDQIMNDIRYMYHKYEETMSDEVLSRIFERGTEPSILGYFALLMVEWLIESCEEATGHIEHQLSKLPGFHDEFVTFLAVDRPTFVPVIDPRISAEAGGYDVCFFHIHGPEDVCHLAK